MLRLAILFFLIFFSIENSVAGISGLDKYGSKDFQGTINAPTNISINYMNSGSDSITLDGRSDYVYSSTINLSKAKNLQIKIDKGDFLTPKRQYKVLYRIDPRFNQPQVFIWKKNDQGNYVSDLTIFDNGKLSQANKDSKGASVDDMIAMDKYISRKATIPIMAKEVVTIKIPQNPILPSELFSNLNIINNPESSDISLFYSSSSSLKNQILYVDAQSFCDYLNNSQQSHDPNIQCSNNGDTYGYTYKGGSYEIYGSISANIYSGNIISCPDDPKGGMIKGLICIYDKGRGLGINIGDKIVKPIYSSMSQDINNPTDYFYYHYSSANTYLSFTNSWQDDYTVSGMFQQSQFPQYMIDWANNSSGSNDAWKNFLATNPEPINNFIFSGNYWMDIEVGQGVSNNNNEDSLSFKYSINGGSDFTSFGLSDVVDIPSGGSQLWIYVDNPKQLTGIISYSYDYYSGGVNISGPINSLIKTIKDNLIGSDGESGVMGELFSGLVKIKLKGISKVLLTLYIMIYAIYFLLGAAEITAKELLVRCVKVTFITQLFDPNSWQFFSSNLFSMFLNGTDYLMKHVIGAGSSVDNLFSFVDPLLQTYLNPDIWAIIGIQLIQFHNGGFLIAIILFIGIFFYLLAILMVIAYYLVTFVSISIMIGLAPIFFCMVLFKNTRPIFEKYLSALFSYMIQPTILLVFILMIDQIVSDQLARALVSCDWGHLFDYTLSLDLGNWGINLAFVLLLSTILGPIPFITYLPFFIPDYQGFGAGGIGGVFANAMLFSCLALIVYRLIPYVDQIVGMLATVSIQSNQGLREKKEDGATSIYHDISSPVRSLMQDPRKTLKSASDSRKSLYSNASYLYNLATVQPNPEPQKQEIQQQNQGSTNTQKDNSLKLEPNPQKDLTGEKTKPLEEDKSKRDLNIDLEGKTEKDLKDKIKEE